MYFVSTDQLLVIMNTGNVHFTLSVLGGILINVIAHTVRPILPKTKNNKFLRRGLCALAQH